jgi:hypothetical protein
MVVLEETGQTVRENCFFFFFLPFKNEFVRRDYDDFSTTVQSRNIVRHALTGVVKKSNTKHYKPSHLLKSKCNATIMLELSIYTAKDEHMYIVLPRMNATSGLLVPDTPCVWRGVNKVTGNYWYVVRRLSVRDRILKGTVNITYPQSSHFGAYTVTMRNSF